MIGGSLALLSGCGSSSSKLSAAAFSSKINAICQTVNVQSKNLQVSGTGGAQDTAALNKVVTLATGAVSKMKALSGPSSLEQARDDFVAEVNQEIAAVRKALAAQKAGNSAQYVSDLRQVAAIEQRGKADGTRLHAPACTM
jgi:hypothetical protein